MPQHDWMKDEVNLDYLLDSGLLFKINQTVLHLFGIAMSVKVNRDTNEKQLSFADMRSNPEDLTFSESNFVTGEEKYLRFRDEFGAKQINRRQAYLGTGCQNHPKVSKKQ